MKATDRQVGGNHYKKYSYQPIEFICDMNLNFIQGNIIKYIARDKGNREEDLQKIIHYCELAQELKVTGTKSFNGDLVRTFTSQFDEFSKHVIDMTVIGFWSAVKKTIRKELKL